MASPAPLPYSDPFLPSERAVIEHALSVAVRGLVESGELDMATSDEVAITTNLVRALNLMLESTTPVVAGFTKALFQSVVRGAELCDHDGANPEKRPDLTFRSQRSLPGLAYPEQCALFVECKIVDAAHSMSLYCGKGISRFVSGTYAWAVSSAVMLGYARNKYHPMQQLKRHLHSYGHRYATVGSLERHAGDVERYDTVHDRSLPKLPPGRAAQITLNHIWIVIA